MSIAKLFRHFMYLLAPLLVSQQVMAIDLDAAVNNISEQAESNGLGDMLLGLIGESDKYWSWWIGAVFLGLITFLFWYFVRIPMAGSSSWQRIVGWREEIERQRVEKQIHAASKDDVMQAMMAETIAEFGQDSVDIMATKGVADTAQEADIPRRAPWQAHITFLLMIGVGGLVASITSGEFNPQLNMGSDFQRLFGEGWQTWMVLLFGGILIGFGTRMAGGCTIGHGLSGLSRVQVGSIVGTASFMGGAIIVSFLIESMLS